MMSARNIYLGVMSVAGVVVGALVLAYPALGKGGFTTPFTVLLVISLIADVGLMRVMRSERLIPLTMPARFGGFFSGVILYLLITFLFGQVHPVA
ncbi:MAG: hypothetical protein JWL62_2767 [Hyphomicrobiales bacterium]|nr:hypothetical protein [Hyphomicrobiales bacterium]